MELVTDAAESGQAMPCSDLGSCRSVPLTSPSLHFKQPSAMGRQTKPGSKERGLSTSACPKESIWHPGPFTQLQLWRHSGGLPQACQEGFLFLQMEYVYLILVFLCVSCFLLHLWLARSLEQDISPWCSRPFATTLVLNPISKTCELPTCEVFTVYCLLINRKNREVVKGMRLWPVQASGLAFGTCENLQYGLPACTTLLL